eukprot:g15099.t1
MVWYGMPFNSSTTKVTYCQEGGNDGKWQYLGISHIISPSGKQIWYINDTDYKHRERLDIQNASRLQYWKTAKYSGRLEI